MPTTIAGDPTNWPVDFTVPSDGDDRDAASVDVAFQALADRTAHLGAFRVMQVQTHGVDDAASAHDQIGSDITSATFVGATGGLSITFSDALAGDVLVLSCSTWANMTGAAQPGALRLYDVVNGVGINCAIPSVPDRVEGSVGAKAQQTISAFYVVPDDTASLQIQLQGRIHDTEHVQIRKPFSIVGTLYRST